MNDTQVQKQPTITAQISPSLQSEEQSTVGTESPPVRDQLIQLHLVSVDLGIDPKKSTEVHLDVASRVGSRILITFRKEYSNLFTIFTLFETHRY